jgi:hypothetical protein
MRTDGTNRPVLTIVVAGALCWGLSTGCGGNAGGQPGDRRLEAPVHRVQQGESSLPSHHLVGVPFFADDTDQCGPATLASVLTFWGAHQEPKSLKAEVYLAKLKGSLPTDLLLAAQRRGFQAEAYRGDLESVKREIGAGHPLIALLNVGSAIFPRGHYVVITGYDDRKKGLYVHSGLTADAWLYYEQFLQEWEKAGRWTLKILPR